MNECMGEEINENIHKYMNELMIIWRNKENHCTDTLMKGWMDGSID